ncbi:MAG: DISARM system SNF2-like helicase DrmD [Microcoleaceae cyanobacterium]
MTTLQQINTLPEQGQLVEVRGCRFVVLDVRSSHLPQNPIIGCSGKTHHLVTLSSLEEDGLGEEIQVMWELEPGAAVYEARELPYPDGFDSPERLDAFLDAVRWGASSYGDMRSVQSPFRSGVDIEEYQLDPVVRAIKMPRVNLLIADDVGLGKTIEAGLVAQELLLRQQIRRILVLCPSALQIQWQEQMRDKFGLEFRIINSDLIRSLRRSRGLHINPWTHYPRLITSIDFIKRERAMRWMHDALPGEGEGIFPRRFDLLIVDEAHNIAPSGGGRYALDSQRTRTIREIAPHFEHKLFLTATPHNGYPESFSALLELLDSQRFARGVPPDKNQLQVVMVRRLKQELPPKWDGSPRFPQRLLEAIPVAYTEIEQQASSGLNQYTKLRRKAAKDKVEQTATEFVLKLLKKRLFSSPAAFLTTLEQHEKSLNSATSKRKRSLSQPSLSILQRQLEAIEEEFADDAVYEEQTQEAVEQTTPLFQALSSEEKQLIFSLKSWAEKAALTPDSKAEKLLTWIAENIRPQGKWSPQRVIIFTEYRTTQKWLYDLLATQGLAKDDRLMTLYGGMESQERERVKAAFQASPEQSNVRILLATDAASEGLDLQNHCSHLIHYEIPWNPNRLEQRNGRIDRHGQKADAVRIYHFVSQGFDSTSITKKPGDLAGDLEFLMRAALKVNTIRQDLGKVGPVIASQVEEAMLGSRITLNTQKAEEASEPVRRLLKFERKVKAEIDKLKQQLDETRQQLHLTPENIESVVQIGLDLAQQPGLIPVENSPGFYHLPPLKGSWAACSQGLAHPHTGNIRPVAFDPDTVRGRDDVVLVHLNHRLVQMCLRLLRAEVWSKDIQRRLYRVTARIVPSSVLEAPAVIAHGRLVVLGGDQQRLHEEIIVAGGLLKAGRFSRLNPTAIEKALAVATLDPVPEAMQQQLIALWDKYNEPLLNSLDVRMKDRQQSLEKSLQERCDKQIADITAILTELKNSIRQELDDGNEPIQLSLFNDAEKEQLERNRNSLEVRLQQIPNEIEQETAIIRSRFANPTPRLFPLTVTYLVPQKFL